MDEATANHVVKKKLNPGTIIAGKYKLIERIGAGSFGTVYKTQNLKNGESVAAKFEQRDETQKGVSLLIREIKVLSEVSGLKGFPQLKFYGRDDNYNFFMESYLGMNLEQLMRKCGGKFTQNTVLQIGIQLIERMQAFHEKNLIHRDIKPENFTISRQDVAQIYVIDFGLAKYYRDTAGKHIPFVSNKGLIGTARYASTNALIGNEQSRRDDIEALAYVLIYFYLGELPWQNIQVTNKEEKYKQILLMKQNNSLDKLKDLLPKSLSKLLKIAKSYDFPQTPDYLGLKKLLQEDITTDSKLDWLRIVTPQNDIEKMNVSIEQDSLDNQFNDLQEVQLGISNSMRNIVIQETKFINGKLNNSRNHIYLEVPKRHSIIVEGATSPAGTIKSFNTSKMNHYETSHKNIASYKQFIDMQVQSIENDYDEDYIPDQDDSPCLLFKNLIVGQKSKQNH